jgi:tetratricopeptide (TPR) repeat protein
MSAAALLIQESTHAARVFAAPVSTCRLRVRACLGAIAVGVMLCISGCETPKPPSATPAGPSAEEVARTQRIERAQKNLAEGLKFYESGNYDEAQRGILLALDSGLLSVAQQIDARKHMAFINCLTNREASCREEFEKAIALDPRFALPAAEAGHPNWGPVFRNLRADIETRKNGRTAPVPTPRALAGGEKLLLEGMSAYEAADFNKAIKLFQDAQKEGLAEPDRVKAIKHSAFSYCVTNRNALCRAEFEKIFAIRPDFNLEPAEAGHPSWGPSFRGVLAKQKAAKQVPVKK